MKDIWDLTTVVERTVIGSGFVALIGNLLSLGGLAEAILVIGPGVVIAGALAANGALRLRAMGRGRQRAPAEAGGTR